MSGFQFLCFSAIFGPLKKCYTEKGRNTPPNMVSFVSLQIHYIPKNLSNLSNGPKTHSTQKTIESRLDNSKLTIYLCEIESRNISSTPVDKTPNSRILANFIFALIRVVLAGFVAPHVSPGSREVFSLLL